MMSVSMQRWRYKVILITSKVFDCEGSLFLIYSNAEKG